MAELDTIAEYLNERLAVRGTPDYPGALNGLQLRNSDGKVVAKVASAVDASLPVVEAAVAGGADLLIVHHGLFWQGARRIDGPFFRKIKSAIDGGLAIYSAHIPLDVHDTYGNNILRANAIGLSACRSFFPWKGIELGLRCSVSLPLSELVEKVENAVGGPVHVCQAGPGKVRKIALITGGAGAEIIKVAAEGVDTFITGEGPHWSYTEAEELGINVIYAGHYATETFGVRALARHVADRYKIPDSEFIDHPTGM